MSKAKLYSEYQSGDTITLNVDGIDRNFTCKGAPGDDGMMKVNGSPLFGDLFTDESGMLYPVDGSKFLDGKGAPTNNESLAVGPNPNFGRPVKAQPSKTQANQ